jgi:hypothetical protein
MLAPKVRNPDGPHVAGGGELLALEMLTALPRWLLIINELERYIGENVENCVQWNLPSRKSCDTVITNLGTSLLTQTVHSLGPEAAALL